MATKHRLQDIYDYRIFPCTKVATGDSVFRFVQGNQEVLKNYIVKAMKRTPDDSLDLSLDDFLATTGTISFLVIRNDSILFENYYKGHSREQVSTVFSISKSVVSLLTGIAIQEGYIGDVRDTVTKYIPGLRSGAPEFQQLTIEELLNMRSGIQFGKRKTGLAAALRWTDFYYGNKQWKHIKKLRFNAEPGTVHEYQNMATVLLGMTLERATGKKLGTYLQEKIWTLMGMEYEASWSLDNGAYRSSKAYSGFNTTALDLAKIGRLYLLQGNWNGRQIVDSAWVAKSVTPNHENNEYQYNWYSFAPDPADFYALGLRQQILFVDPEKKMIVVRLGEFSNLPEDYPVFIYNLIKSL